MGELHIISRSLVQHHIVDTLFEQELLLLLNRSCAITHPVLAFLFNQIPLERSSDRVSFGESD